MDRITLTSRVGADGVLHVVVPIGPAAADQPVQVTIEPSAVSSNGDHAAWLESVAGQWQGEFDRPPQGRLENREPMA